MIAETSMQADGPREPGVERESGPGAADQEIQQILRAARADLALLGLKLRTARREADDAERRAREASADGDEVDLAGARALQQQTLRLWIESRRRELAHDLEEARREAMETIAHARREAMEVTVRASDEARRLLDSTGMLAPDRVWDRPAPQSPGEAVRAPHRETVADPPKSSAVPSESMVVSPGSPGEEHVEAEPLAAVGVPLAAAAAPDFAAPAEVQPGVALQEWPAPTEEERWAPPPPTVTPAPGQKERRRASVQQSESEVVAKRRSWTTFLYLDVLLPLIAVVIVVVVLLAWIG